MNFWHDYFTYYDRHLELFNINSNWTKRSKGQSVITGMLILGGLAALAFGIWWCHLGPSWPKTIVKTLPVLSMALVAYWQDAPTMLWVAFGLCALGDFVLSRPGRAGFLGGLVAFALGHLAYVILFVQTGTFTLTVIGTIAVAMLFMAIVSTRIWLEPFTANLLWPVRIYCAIIFTMIALAVVMGQPALVLIGVFAFGTSDAILGLHLFRSQKFGPRHRETSIAIWTFYIVAQALIFAGFTPGVI